eukprot:10580575-Ditylum_brightwellii.AAC.1
MPGWKPKRKAAPPTEKKSKKKKPSSTKDVFVMLMQSHYDGGDPQDPKILGVFETKTAAVEYIPNCTTQTGENFP